MVEKLKVKMFDSLGCNVASTALIYSLKDKFPNAEIEIITKFPELFENIGGIKINNLEEGNIKFEVDLRNYLERRPNNNKPYRPLYIHILEVAEEQLSVKLKRFFPSIKLLNEEIKWADNELKKYKKPVIWIQSKTNSQNKDLPEEYWEEIIKDLNKNYDIIDLSKTKFSLRQSLAIAKVAKGGITLDTFMVHGSASVRAENVLVLLGSSRKEVVSYPFQEVSYIKTNCSIQPCGMHGYSFGCEKNDEKLFKGHEKTRCIFDDFRCMKVLKPELVIKKFRELVKN